MKAYWWKTQPNFGDRLTPYIIHKLFGYIPQWSTPQESEVVVVGSVIDVLPKSWTGTIAGAGKLHENSTIPPFAHVKGLRGHLTAKGFPGNVAIGDPGLIVDECCIPQEKIHNLGIVPHWTDKTLAGKFAYLDPYIIDPSLPPSKVISKIARCKKIVASSLHGIVVADAFDIPRRAEMFPAMNSQYEGGTFKFEDYSSGIGFPVEFGKLQSPPRKNIERVQAEVFEMLQETFNGKD